MPSEWSRKKHGTSQDPRVEPRVDLRLERRREIHRQMDIPPWRTLSPSHRLRAQDMDIPSPYRLPKTCGHRPLHVGLYASEKDDLLCRSERDVRRLCVSHMEPDFVLDSNSADSCLMNCKHGLSVLNRTGKRQPTVSLSTSCIGAGRASPRF